MYESRVKTGMKLLDKLYGKEWYKDIDLNVFDISDGQQCLLGQLGQKRAGYPVHGAYYLEKQYFHISHPQAIACGLLLDDGWYHLDTRLAKLQTAWIAAIQQKQKGETD